MHALELIDNISGQGVCAFCSHNVFTPTSLAVPPYPNPSPGTNWVGKRVGNDVGAAEGDFDGVIEGKELGATDGEELGIAEGEAVGGIEGGEVGAMDGEELGLAEGEVLGAAEGDRLCVAEGEEVHGSGDGRRVGAFVGLSVVGRVVGAGLGLVLIVGATVGAYAAVSCMYCVCMWACAPRGACVVCRHVHT